MHEIVYQDVFGDEVVLTDSVRATILTKHPEVVGFIDQLNLVLADPDEIHSSVRDERTALYYRFEAALLGGKWIVVVVKRIDRNFISTIYATDRIKEGAALWTKNT